MDSEPPIPDSDDLAAEMPPAEVAGERGGAGDDAEDAGASLGERLLRRSRGLVERLEQGDRRRRLVLAFVAVVVTSLAAGLVAGTCFGGAPSDPIEELGLDRDPSSKAVSGAAAPGVGSAATTSPRPVAEPVIDAEQEVFAERRQRQLADRQRLEESSGVPDFTDHALVTELSGLWNLDLGRGRRGFRVRFGADPVRTVHRERFDVTLFGAEGRGLPPYFTVLDLPEGKLLAFLDASGSFRLVLEDLRRESDGRLSWRGSGLGRRYGRKLDGPSPWRFGGYDSGSDDSGPFGRRDDGDESPDSRRGGNRRDETRVGARPREAPTVTSREALDEVERHVDELALGLMSRDPRRVYGLWAGRPDDVTREAVSGLLSRYSGLRVWARVLSVDVVATTEGTEARFEAVVTMQGMPGGARNRRDVELRDVRWRGRILFSGERPQGVQLDPFPG